MNRTRTACAACVAVFFLMLPAAFAYSPVANLTEKFNADVGWKGDNFSSLTLWMNETMSVTFSNRPVGEASWPQPQSGMMWAQGDSSSGHYVGNYGASEITGIAFDVRRIGMEKCANVYVATSSRAWIKNVSLLQGTSVWEHVNVSLAYSNEWGLFQGELPQGVSTASAFLADMTNIGYVFIEGIRTGVVAERLDVDNFKVVGSWDAPGAPFTGELPSFWLQEYGQAAGSETNDVDHDGLSNYGEYLAGSDPTNSLSRFLVELTRDGNGSPALKWGRQARRTYTVLRSSDLVGGGFSSVGDPIQGTEGANPLPVEELTAGPWFYKVQMEKQP